jgi:hypothetical protein
MTAILSLSLLVSGLLMIVGARDAAKKIIGGMVMLLVFLALAPCLLCALASPFQGHAGSGAGDYPLWPVLIFAVFAIAGFALWRRRETRTRVLEQTRRRHGQARKRALPPAPPPDGDNL